MRGNHNPWYCEKPSMGLSPPMRGNRKDRMSRSVTIGSIPAHAGKPTSRRSARANRRVYPRPCGETMASAIQTSLPPGLSPPMRGNHCMLRQSLACFGSIPAHAGKPNGRVGWRICTGVYPRPCGETRQVCLVLRSGFGLSPPMRGNLFPMPRLPTRMGSIPAHAGKPDPEPVFLDVNRVYPRPCGETSRD